MDLIKIALGDYPRYEELLLRKDKFEKEAILWYTAYIKVFGKYLIDLFEIKVECIRLKKLISYAQAEINKGFTPNMDEINKIVAEQMRSYYEELDVMIKDHNESLKSKSLPAHVILKVKKIYREIAKILHPDINPETGKDPELQDLWNRVSVAYKCNNLEEIEELQVLVNKALSEKGFDVTKVVIPNIEEKIKKLEEEINRIITTDPYNYKFILEDKEETEQMKKDLENEQKEYNNYKTELETVLSELTGD
ncbi:MAG: hypothetical protein IKG03_07270 [Clostridiales bacterium]|nr:hypothetical protein [Clostridiales bacterium]